MTTRELKTAAMVMVALLAANIVAADGPRTASVSWQPVTARVDGTALDNVSYEIIVNQGDIETAYSTQETSISPPVSAPGQLCARARAVDSDGLASAWSAPACKTFSAEPRTVILSWQ